MEQNKDIINKNNSFAEILEVVKNSNNILLTAHVSPDGDAIGSGLALLLGLKKYNAYLRDIAKEKNEEYRNKTFRFILEDSVPKNLKFLSKSKLVETLEDFKYTENFEKESKFDLAICLDSGAYHRIGKVEELIKENTPIVNIDHHISNDYYGNYNHLVTDGSSTSEIIFDFLQETNISLDKDMAEAIYTGLVNDTGNFKHSNTTKKVFLTAGELLDYGVEPNHVIKEFFNTQSLAKMKLTGQVLSGFKFVDNLNLVYYYISSSEMEKIGVTKNDSNGLVETLLSFEKASVSLLMKEDNGYIKGSFRSKYDVDVNAIASNFGGGGHIKAAGFKTDKSLGEILEIVKKELSQEN